MTSPLRPQLRPLSRVLCSGCLALAAALGSGVTTSEAEDGRAAQVLSHDRGARLIALTPSRALSQPFRPAEKPVMGSYSIRREGGRTILTLSKDFRTSDSAPDLKLTLGRSATPLAGSKPPQYALRAGTYTVLEPLKSSAGTQSYVIPASIDLKAYGSVLIWCEKFNATMAWAPLKP